MKKIKILLADDHLVVRMGLVSLLGLEQDIEVVGEASDGAEAVAAAKTLKPDVVVMDLVMPKMGGIEATSRIVREMPSARVLILTTFIDSPDVRLALDAGAAGVIVKGSDRATLVSAIRGVAAGKHIVDREARASLSAKTARPNLSPRQIEILGYIAKGLNNKEIATLIGIGRDCVKAHLKTAFARLGSASRSEAVAIAIKLGILDA